jgi:hypothetical protein
VCLKLPRICWMFSWSMRYISLPATASQNMQQWSQGAHLPASALLRPTCTHPHTTLRPLSASGSDNLNKLLQPSIPPSHVTLHADGMRLLVDPLAAGSAAAAAAATTKQPSPAVSPTPASQSPHLHTAAGCTTSLGVGAFLRAPTRVLISLLVA